MAIRNKAFNKVAALSNKVAEVELSKETVELGVGQDVQKAVSQLSGSMSKIENIATKASAAGDKYEAAQLKAYNNVLDAQDKLFDQLKKEEKAFGGAKDVVKKAEAAAKDLGVNVDDIKGIKELKKLISDIPDAFNAVSSDIKKLDSITI